MGRPVPDSTKILLGAGQWCRENIAWCGAGLVGLVVAGFCFRNHPLTRRAFDWLLTYAPIIRNAYRPLACGRLFRLIGSMLAGGVPLLEAIRLTQKSVSNGYFRELLEQIEEDVLAGDHMNRAMVDADFLPPEAAQMVATAERTGRLADVLMDCGLFYEEQGERLLRKVVHSLEPVIILAMGVLVAGVVLSIMLPLLDMSSVA